FDDLASATRGASSGPTASSHHSANSLDGFAPIGSGALLPFVSAPTGTLVALGEVVMAIVQVAVRFAPRALQVLDHALVVALALAAEGAQRYPTGGEVQWMGSAATSTCCTAARASAM